MKVSIVIPTYNKIERLKLVLASFKTQTYPLSKYEVIIVNDGSTDDTAQTIEQYSVPFELKFINIKNSGRAAARNIGIKHANNPLIIFTDDDRILSPTFISEHVKLQDKGFKVVHGKMLDLPYLRFFKDPTNGILYPGLEISNSSLDQIKKRCVSEKDIIEDFESVIPKNSKITALESAIRTVLDAKSLNSDWISFTGGNVSLQRKWIDEVGGFDKNFGLNWGCEDLELGYRLCLKGYSFIYGENAVNYHLTHFKQNFESEHSQTAQYFFDKYGDNKILCLQGFVDGTVKKEEFISKML